MATLASSSASLGNATAGPATRIGMQAPASLPVTLASTASASTAAQAIPVSSIQGVQAVAAAAPVPSSRLMPNVANMQRYLDENHCLLRAIVEAQNSRRTNDALFYQQQLQNNLAILCASADLQIPSGHVTVVPPTGPVAAIPVAAAAVAPGLHKGRR